MNYNTLICYFLQPTLLLSVCILVVIAKLRSFFFQTKKRKKYHTCNSVYNTVSYVSRKIECLRIITIYSFGGSQSKTAFTLMRIFNIFFRSVCIFARILLQHNVQNIFIFLLIFYQDINISYHICIF